jgi:hypothetical protein
MFNSKELNNPSITRIIFFDKLIIWEIDYNEKKCIEQQLLPERLKDFTFLWGEKKAKSQKIGDAKILGYDCDKYSYNNDKSIFWLIKDTNIMLRSEENHDVAKTITQAKEIQFTKPDDSIFTVPKGIKKITLKLTTDEELNKEPSVTPERIAALLFEDIDAVSFFIDGKLHFLSQKEKKVLKESIENGTDLVDVSADDISQEMSNESNLRFTISWKNGKDSLCYIYFDKVSGYLYFNKEDVYRKSKEQHFFDDKWINKFLKNGYKLKPSDDFYELLKY